MSELNHKDLVRLATVWLRGSRRCRVVAAEISTPTPETPDAIGWDARHSICVECKVSIEDFRRNSLKPHEHGGLAVGDERWFLTPEGLLRPHHVPEGWGLLEARTYGTGKRDHFLRKVVVAPIRVRTVESLTAERKMLVSIAWRSLEALHLVRPLTITLEEVPE